MLEKLAWRPILRPLFKGAAEQALALVLPHRCPSCGVPVAQAATFCSACWPHLRFLTQPLCIRCGEPQEDHVLDSASPLICAPCLQAPPLWRQARAAFSYEGAARDALLAFKHHDHLEMAILFARHMVRVGADLLAQPQAVLVPVPLNRWRLFKRTYNQAALLAQSMGRLTNVPVKLQALVRVRATPSQQGLSLEARARNVRRAFSVPLAMQKQVQARPVILVDDVVTTGATVTACTAALLKAGAAHVDILSATRVLRSQNSF
jgi:ComF family protein